MRRYNDLQRFSRADTSARNDASNIETNSDIRATLDISESNEVVSEGVEDIWEGMEIGELFDRPNEHAFGEDEIERAMQFLASFQDPAFDTMTEDGVESPTFTLVPDSLEVE